MPYGNGTFTGQYATDHVCLVLGECLERFEYLSVNSYTGFNLTEDINGLFGWARPNRTMQLNPSATPESNPEFMLTAMFN